MNKMLDKFRGCLIAGAAGDALGYAVEFIREGQIFETYGERGITEYKLRDGKAIISDDTQMTLFTANGILFGADRMRRGDISCAYSDYIALAYKDWYGTQGRTKLQEPVMWLTTVPELNVPRAPGLTCLGAIEAGCYGTIREPINNSKGCGGIMRVAPIGLYFRDNIVDSDIIAAKASALTHGHELGYLPSAVFAHVIAAVSGDDDVRLMDAVTDARDTVKMLFPAAQHMGRLTELIDLAVELSQSEQSDLDCIHQLGEGWVGEEALAIALFCALRYENDIEQALIASVNHNGDSDSTGAVTGNIIGAYLGYEAIPGKFRQDLELHDTIIEIADDLYYDSIGTDHSGDERWERLYRS